MRIIRLNTKVNMVISMALISNLSEIHFGGIPEGIVCDSHHRNCAFEAAHSKITENALMALEGA